MGSCDSHDLNNASGHISISQITNINVSRSNNYKIKQNNNNKLTYVVTM